MSEQWTVEDDYRLRSMKTSGSSWSEISSAMGRSVDSARGRWRNIQHLVGQQQVPAGELQRFSESAARLSGKTVVSESPRNTKRLDVKHAWIDPDLDIDEVWRKAEEDSQQRIEKARNHARFSVQLPSDRVSAISFASDQHIAPGTPVDFKRMREDAELIAETDDLYAILGGDGVDNHVKHISAIIAARSQPSDQYVLYEHYLQILLDSLICVTSGNHDLWSNQYAGIDVVSAICKKKKLAYAPYEARVDVGCGSQKYKVAVRHQYKFNSQMNQTHAVKQWLRLGEDVFDIGCICHHHEAAIEQTMHYNKIVWCCRPGAYQITSAYSQQYGFNASVPTCPTFLVFPDRHHIIGLHSVSDAPKILRAFNG